MTISKRSPAPGVMTDIEPRKLTLTKRPANKKTFVFTKSKETTMDNVVELIKSTELDNEEELRSELAELGKSEETIDAVVAAMRGINAYSDSVTAEDVGKALEAVGFAVDSNSDTNDGGSDTDDVEKSELLKTVERQEETIEKQSDRLDELEKALETSREQDATEKWVSKAEEIDNLSTDAESLGQRLRTIEKEEGEEAADEMLDTLRSADKVAGDSDLFKEEGVSGDGGTTSAEEELEKRATEVKKDNPEMSTLEAKKQAYRQMDQEDRENIEL